MIANGVLATTLLSPVDVQNLLAAHRDHAEPVDLMIDLVALYARLDCGSDG